MYRVVTVREMSGRSGRCQGDVRDFLNFAEKSGRFVTYLSNFFSFNMLALSLLFVLLRCVPNVLRLIYKYQFLSDLHFFSTTIRHMHMIGLPR